MYVGKRKAASAPLLDEKIVKEKYCCACSFSNFCFMIKLIDMFNVNAKPIPTLLERELELPEQLLELLFVCWQRRKKKNESKHD
jgi:hypothetical protein